MTPRNAEKFMEWSTESSGAPSASGRKRAQDSGKVLNLNIKYPVSRLHTTQARDAFYERYQQVLPLFSQLGV